MAQAFCGTKVSPRMSRDNAGNLICHGAIIARSGRQTYRASEIGLATDELVQVHRSPEEVLSNAAIASAHGKLVTDGHPGQFLAPWNSGVYGKGFVLNPREGPILKTGDRTIIADLVIFDGNLISKIIDGGLREMSAGYDAEYLPQSDGTFEQTKIRINHVALVPSGRCGAVCRVQDHDHEEQRPMTRAERAQLAEAMELVRELNEAFRERQRTLDSAIRDCESDRAFGERAREFHRGGKTVVTKETLKQTAQDAQDWATVMNAYGRLLRAGKR